MNAQLTRIASLLVVLFTFAQARAQQGAPAQVQPRGTVLHNTSAGYPNYPVYIFPRGWGWRPKAATAGESFARGHADVVRAQAMYNVAMAHVRAVDTETHERQIQYYYANKETNSQYRESVRRPRISAEDAARLAQAGRPKAASPEELDARTGAINWPVLLQSDEFDGYRADVEILFAQRAADGGLAVDEHAHLQETTDAMKEQLSKRVRQVNPADYIEAKRFIETLAFEGREG